MAAASGDWEMGSRLELDKGNSECEPAGGLALHVYPGVLGRHVGFSTLLSCLIGVFVPTMSHRKIFTLKTWAPIRCNRRPQNLCLTPI